MSKPLRKVDPTNPHDWYFPDTLNENQTVVEKQHEKCLDCGGEGGYDGVNDEGDFVRIDCRNCGGSGTITKYVQR